MAKVQHSVTIDQPVEQVFAFITDTRNTTRWQPLISEARATLEGPAQIGAQVTEVRTFIGRKMESTYEIVELEPNKRMVLKSVGGPFPYKGTITFESLGNATKVTFEAETETRGFFKLADGMIAGSMRKKWETNLSTAKQVVETGA